jgi:hypothetical protein
VKDIFKDNPIEGFTKGTGGTEYSFLLSARPGGSDCPSAVFRKLRFQMIADIARAGVVII